MFNPNEWFNTREAAEIADRDRRTIVNWIRSGKLPAVKLPGAKGQYRIRKNDLNEVLTRPAATKAQEMEKVEAPSFSG